MVRRVLRGGQVIDGTGREAFGADVLVDGDRVVEVGDIGDVDAEVVDASGCVVAPGFVDVLSHAYFSLQRDPRGVAALAQGVTTVVFGEGYSLGPVPPSIQPFLGYEMSDDITWAWPRLGEALASYETRGTALNVASFVGHHNLRLLGAGADDRPMSDAELDHVSGVLDEELADGALGLGSALMYAPAQYAPTEELVALGRVVAYHDGLHISHLREESTGLLGAVEELLRIGRESGVRSEAHHLKAAGRPAWPLMSRALDQIEDAQRSGLAAGGNMYPYVAGGTALAASIPQEFHEGGISALLRRLADPAERAAVATVMRAESGGRANFLVDAGGPAGVVFGDDRPTDVLSVRVRGRSLADVATDLGEDPIDLLLRVVAAAPDTMAMYFIASDDNLREIARRPWVCFGSDADTPDPAGTDPGMLNHPRAFGTFARVLARFVREEGLISLPEAVRRMTSLPADRLRLRDRGRVQPGRFANLVVFDPETVRDESTYAEPSRLATGVRHVLVNGDLTYADGGCTGALSGRALRRAR